MVLGPRVLGTILGGTSCPATPGPNLQVRLGKPCLENPGPEKFESAKCSVNMRACTISAPDISPRPCVNAALDGCLQILHESIYASMPIL